MISERGFGGTQNIFVVDRPIWPLYKKVAVTMPGASYE